VGSGNYTCLFPELKSKFLKSSLNSIIFFACDVCVCAVCVCGL
jgi:hypothetical protein